MQSSWTEHSGRFLAPTALGLAAALTMPAAATRYHVDWATGDDNNNGFLWSTAFATIHKALDAAANDLNFPHEIWVAAGTYIPPDGVDPPPADPRAVSFELINGVSVLGGFAGGETEPGQADFQAHISAVSDAEAFACGCVLEALLTTQP